MSRFNFCIGIIAFFVACDQHPGSSDAPRAGSEIAFTKHLEYDTSKKTIHVLVALCDNKYQGIVPVPAKIGNGQDPGNNLYWGCAYGVRTYFKNSPNWQLLKRYFIDSIKLERLVFKHRRKNFYLVADAYNGKNIRECTVDFLQSCAGVIKDTLKIRGTTIGMHGNAVLLAYTGHDGLMDFALTQQYTNRDNRNRDAIILACYSKKYFASHLAAAGATPLVWSTGLMSPEAYTLHDALESYIDNKPAGDPRNSAARAYAKYQRCSEKAAKKLLMQGF